MTVRVPSLSRRAAADPAAFVGSVAARERCFYNVALTLNRRLQIFTSLPLEQLDKLKVEKLTRDIALDRLKSPDSAA